jgi:hypothetical protein
VTASLALKANSTSVEALAARIDNGLQMVDALTTTVAGKANITTVSALAAQLGSATSIGPAQVATVTALDTATVAALALKADQATVDALTSIVGTKADDVATTTAVGLKADQTEVDTLTTTVGTKADATALALKADDAATTAALDLKADSTAVAALAAHLGSAAAEVAACRCAECADEPIGGSLCASYGPVTPCECEDSSGSTDPVRQGYPMTQSSPPCCREIWPAATTVTQTSMVDPQVYSQDDILVRVGAQVTFTFTGFENVEEVGDFASYTHACLQRHPQRRSGKWRDFHAHFYHSRHILLPQPDTPDAPG